MPWGVGVRPGGVGRALEGRGGLWRGGLRPAGCAGTPRARRAPCRAPGESRRGPRAPCGGSRHALEVHISALKGASPPGGQLRGLHERCTERTGWPESVRKLEGARLHHLMGSILGALALGAPRALRSCLEKKAWGWPARGACRCSWRKFHWTGGPAAAAGGSSTGRCAVLGARWQAAQAARGTCDLLSGNAGMAMGVRMGALQSTGACAKAWQGTGGRG
jgi:hypothetical protein